MDLTVVFFRAREEGVLAAMCVLAAIQSRLTHRCPRSSRPLYLARMLSDFSRARLLAYCANLLQSRPFPQWDCDSGHRRLMTFAAKFFLYAKVSVAVVMLAVIVSSEGVTRVQLRARSGTVAGMVMHCLVPCLETPDTCRQSVCVCVFVVGG